MNSRQRRARIRAGMPGVMHRILTMKLMGDISTSIADGYLQRLRSDNLSLVMFERIVRAAAEFERQTELRAALKGYVSLTGASYSGKAAYTIVFDEATTIK